MIKIELADKRTPIAAFTASEVRLVRDCLQYREVYLKSRKNAYHVTEDFDAILGAVKSDLGTLSLSFTCNKNQFLETIYRSNCPKISHNNLRVVSLCLREELSICYVGDYRNWSVGASQ